MLRQLEIGFLLISQREPQKDLKDLKKTSERPKKSSKRPQKDLKKTLKRPQKDLKKTLTPVNFRCLDGLEIGFLLLPSSLIKFIFTVK